MWVINIFSSKLYSKFITLASIFFYKNMPFKTIPFDEVVTLNNAVHSNILISIDKIITTTTTIVTTDAEASFLPLTP